MTHRVTRIRRLPSLGLSLALIISIVPAVITFTAEPARAAAGTLTSGSCTANVGETLTATIAQVGGTDCVITFTSGSNSFTPPTGVREISLLVVAGGGSGGARAGGGGGAGGYVSLTNVSVTPGSASSLTVGTGGASRSGAPTSGTMPGSNGGNSTFALASSTITAVGGGGGGGGFGCTAAAGCAGVVGGSAGGSAGPIASASATQGANNYGNGRDGAQGTNGGISNWSGGGGGGASSAGGAGSTNAANPPLTNGGNGGAGFANSITGTALCYAAGGGGGIEASSTGSAGSGGTCSGVAGSPAGAGSKGVTTASSAVANTGSGGGGSGFSGTDATVGGGNSGAGGSGVVVVRWTIPGNTGAFPDVSGMSARFNANNFNTTLNSGLGTWADTSGTGKHIAGSNITGTAITVGTSGSAANGASNSFNVVNGTSGSNVLMLSGADITGKYTLFTVARYSGSTRGRIFQGTAGNYLSGFWNGMSGIMHKYVWQTPYSQPADIGVTDWVLGSECSYDPSPVSNSCTSTYSAQGRQRSTTTNADTGQYGLAINGKGAQAAESSDFQIADVIVFNRVLTIQEANQVEDYIANRYGISIYSDVVANFDPGAATNANTNGSNVSALKNVSVDGKRVDTLDMTRAGTPTYSSSNGGIINFANSTASAAQYLQSTGTIRPMSRFTSEAWIRTTAYPASSDNSFVTMNYNAQYQVITPNMSLNSAGVPWTGFFDGVTWYSAYPSTAIGTNQWKHVVVTYDGLNLVQYINGVQSSTAAVAANSSGAIRNLRLGYRWDSEFSGFSSYGFTGSMGLVKITDRALNASEVSSSFNTNAPRYLAPANTVLPVVTGTTSVGSNLTISNGSWNYSPTGYTYQWSRATSAAGTYTDISGATSNTYTLTNADANLFLKATVTASNIGGSASATSSATTAISPPTCSPTSSTSGGYTTLTFTSRAICNWSVPAGVSAVDLLAVGAGGGGGGDGGSGGGGGELRSASTYSVNGISALAINVGTGGTAGSWGPASTAGSSTIVKKIDNSLLFEAKGGGGGNGWTVQTAVPGGTGGSGGTGTNGQGGGLGPLDCSAVTEASGSYTIGSSPAGSAPSNSITGSAVNYGGGGGGGGGYQLFNSGVAKFGAAGGGTNSGGRGANYKYGRDGSASSGASRGSDGFANSGGGGGGGSACDAYAAYNSTFASNITIDGTTYSAGQVVDGRAQRTAGGNGADGVVVIKYFSSALGAPTGLTLTSAATSMNLSWTAPATNGSTISDYLVEYQLKGGSWTSFPHTASASTSITVAGLTANSIYNFRVSAINAFGTGTASAVRSAITIPNLISFLDASDTNSYSGSGSAWNDLTGRGNGATSQNFASSTITTTTPTYDASGFFTLNGTSNYFDFGTNTNLDFDSTTDNFTLSVLFSPSNTTSAQTQALLSKWDNNIAGTYTLQIPGGTSQVGGYKNVNPWGVASGTKITNGGKYLATFVYDGTTDVISIYINGLLEATRTVGMGGTSSLSALLGAQRTNSTQIVNFLSGKIYGATVFNNALSAAQVAALSAALQPSAKVTFNANGGSGTMADQSFTAGTTVALNANAFTRAGYSFAGWATNADGTGTLYSNSAAQALYGDLYLYARWTALTYSITYNSTNSALGPESGAGSAPATQTGSGVASITLSNNTLAATGFTFAGWATSNGSTTVTYTNQQSIPITQNLTLTLFPVWNCNPTTTTANGYTVNSFTAVGSCLWVIPSIVSSLDYLVVGGGGAGGGSQLSTHYAGGGGGGGGVRASTATVSPTTITVNVGAGQTTGCVAGRGGSSSFSGSGILTITASGGGRGSCNTSASAGSGGIDGSAGGSGGGGGAQVYSKAAGAGNFGSFSPVEGFAGGTALANTTNGNAQAGGGGGGASEAGQNAYLSVGGCGGRGGDGFTSSITGAAVVYGGGGGGGTRSYSCGGTAGTGGGGSGGVNGGQGSAGTDGLGGGGGGTSLANGNRGGNGVVILRYVSAVTITPTVSPTSITFGSSTAITASYTQTPTYTLTTNPTCEIYSDVARTNKISTNGSISAATAASLNAGTYYVNCSGAVATNGPSISYASDATFTVNPAPVTTVTTPTLAVTSATAASLTATWTGVSNATSYTVKVYNSTGATVLATITSATSPLVINSTNFASITGGTGYRVTLTAIGTGNYANANESSQSSSVTTLNTQAGISFVGSSAPLNTTITLSATGGSGTGAFSFSVATGGTATGCSINGTDLTATAAGTCLVVATKASDSSFVARSTSNTTFTFTLTAPDAPTSISAVGGVRQVRMTFVPGSDNGAAITNYEYSFDGTGVWTAFSPAVTSSPVVITGLNDGVAYNIRLRAVNTAGSGAQSNIGNATTFSTCTATTDNSSVPGYTIRTFTSAGNCSYTAPAGITTVEVVVVGGGGAAGHNSGGGGSGGAISYSSTASVTSSVQVTVGNGGAAFGTGNGIDGNPSSFGALTAPGGKGGNAYVSGRAAGGAAVSGTGSGTLCTSATSGAGGSGSSNSSELGLPGSAGPTCSITGSAVNYGGGGGGGGWSTNTTGGAGSAGGGGAGGGGSTSRNGTSGTSNTGGGGGAGASSTATNGSGGSGVVIIRIANSNTYTYDLNGGTGTIPTGGTALTGSNITTAAGTGLTRTGYTFAGWNTAANGGGTALAANSTVAMPASATALIFYAQWTANTLTITYDTQSGSAIANGSTTTGASIAASPGTPTRSGFTFAGWFTASTGGSAITFPYAHNQTNNFTLFAQWATVPGAPTIGTPTAGSGQITVNWSAPASNGGSAITNYIVDYSSDAGSTWTTFTASASTTTSRTVTGLTNGIAYRFRVSAVNIVGTGTASATSITLTPTGVTTACSTAAGTGDPYRVDAGGSPTNETCNKAFDNSTSTKYVNWGGVNQNNGSNGVGGNGGVNTSVLIDLKGPWAITKIGLTTTNDYENRDPVSFQLYGSNTSFTSGMTLLGTVTSMSPPTTRNTDYTSDAAISSQGSFRYYQLKFTGIRSETPDPLVAVSEIRLYGVQNPTIITATFDANGGTGSSSATTISNGSLLVAPTTPTRAGYNFLGWTVLATGGSTISFPYSHGQSANFTLYARWNAAQQTISYNANGGTGTPIPTLGNTDTTVTLRPGSEFTRSGYTLLRWDTSSAGTGTSYSLGQTGLTMPAGGFTLYAIWSANSQTITYMPGTGGSGTVAATTGNTDSTVTLSNGSGFTRQWYTISRWDSSSAGNATPYALGQTGVSMPAGGLTLWAVWSGNQYVYNANGGSGSTAAQTFIGNSMSAQSNGFTPPSGYTFGGWCTTQPALGAACSGAQYGGGSSSSLPNPESTTVTLFAIWTGVSQSITYNANSGTGTITATTGNTGATISLNNGTNFTRSGYTLLRWNTLSGGGGSNYTLGQTGVTMPAGGLTLYAVWSANQYVYNGNTGTGSAPATQTFAGSALTANANTFIAPTNYAFDGWCTTQPSVGATCSGTKYAAGATLPTPTSATVTLYAIWKLNSFTVTYSAATATSGTPSVASASYTVGNPGLTLATVGTMVKTGHTFAGWSTTSGSAADTSAPYILTQDITLYAAWTVNTYNVNFDSRSGSTVTAGTFTYAGTVAAPTPPTRTGYTFNGWFTATSGGSALLFPYAPGGTSDVTLYAQWTAINYIIAYARNGGTGTVPTEPTKNIGNTFTVAGIGTVEKTGYNFAGWSDGTTLYQPGDTYTVGSSNVTLTAQWTIAVYTITYNANSGTGSASRSTENYTYGSPAINLPIVGTLARVGYTFAGWSESTSGAAISGAYTPTQTRTLYAVWNANTYTISYNINGAGGTGPANGSYTTAGTTVTLPGIGSMTRTGYDFGGWATTAGGTAISNTGYTTTSDVTLFAVWTIKTITVTYNAGLAGGAAPNPTLTSFPTNTSGTYGSNITISATIDAYANNNNYAFAGWSDGTSIYNKGDIYRLQDAPLTLTAQWIAIYAVRYSLGGGTLAPGTFTYDAECVADAVEQKCSNGQAITANASPSRAGYTFAGWKDQSGNAISQAANGWTITSTSYLAFASWTPIAYQISYDSAGGSLAPTESTKNIGDLITVKAAVARTGYTFNGWVANGVTYGPGATIQIGTSDISFTASWSAINYVASYDLNGGTSAVPASVTTIYLNNVSVATAPTRPGYTFNDWSDGSGAVTAGSNYGMPARNVTFTAQWTAIDYSVSYNSNGGSTAPSGLSGRHIGDTFLVGTAVTLAGRLFLGWSDGTNTYSPGQTYVVQTSNIAFTAVWSGQLYTITYLANGGSGSAPIEGDRLTNDSFFIASGASLNRTGYTFAGWLSGGQTYQPNDIFTVAATNVTFTALWNKNSITLTFDANGGSPASATQNVTADTATNLTANTFSRTDYTFGGWTANNDGTGSQFTNGQSINFLESKTLYAKWIPAFVVTFNANGGSAVSPLTYTGTALTKPTDPTRTGFTFSGWSNGITVVNWSYSPSASITLNAQWSANTLNITYEVEGGSAPNGGVSSTVTEAIIPTLPSTSRAGYDFNGWFTAASGGARVTTSAAHGRTSNFTLHAQWSARSLAISYNGNGAGVTGVSGGPATTLTDGTLNSLPTPARAGYSFTGWFTQSSGGSQITTASGHGQTSDFSLFAQWNANNYSITLDKNDGSNGVLTQANVTADQPTPLSSASSLSLSRANFAFDGWSENADGSGTTYGDGDNITILGAKTLYAKWRATNYIVTYAAGTNGTAPRANDNFAIGGLGLTLPLPTRANFTFDGWYDSTSLVNGILNGSGNKVGNAGVSYTPNATKTLHARWIQTSLYGVDPNALTDLGSVIASPTLRNGLSASYGNTDISISVPAGALPTNTRVSAKLVGDFSRASSLLNNSNNIILSMVVSWLAPDETVPDTAAGLPLRMVVEHPDIRPGSSIYSILGSSVTLLGRATETGRATFYLQSDPELVIAATGPDEPTSVTALPGNTEATVSWSAPAIDGGSPITGYRATANTGQSCTTTGALSCTITGLTNGSSYTFTAVAINARAESISSSPSAAVTPRTVPGAPTSVTATPGNSQATLSWSAPTSNGGASITGYSVTSSPAITAPADCTNTANLSCTFSGLANGTSYTFTVVALNAAGSSASSLASTAVTPRTIPGAPTDVSATPGNTQAVISWSAPTSDGGSAITGYTITSSPGANTCTTTGATSCTVTGLTNGTSYTFTVIATNVAGSSSASVASAAVTPRTIPDAPTGVSASIGNSQSIVTWQAPASNGGSAISGYSVTSSPLVSVPVGCTAINALTCTFTGLTNGTAYTFTVTAINAAGNSSASSPSSAVTPRTVPGAPTAVTTTAGNTQVIITWNAPTSDGGSAITGYSVTSSPSVTAPVGCTNVNALTCTFTGLTNGVAYTFIVTAINGAGTVAADPTAAVTPRTLPDAPTAVTAVAGNARATLSWTAPVSNGGSAITGYTVTSSPAITAPSDCTNTINLTCTFSGLTNGTVYTFTLIATNIAGSSIASASSNSVTPVTVPDAPTNVTATAGDAQIDLTWLAPTVDGGAAITGYTVVSSPAITAPVACTATTSLNCTFTGLTNGTAYTFTVIAINTVGNSLLSVASAATTPRTIPDAPTGVIATSGNAQAVITWSAPAFNGGSPITNYAVSSLPAVTPPAGCTTTTALTCVFTGLTNGTAYTFTVIATNIAGDSIASLASAPMTPAVPPTPATVTTSLTQEPEPSEPPADLQKPIEELDPIVVVVPAEPITQNEDGISILSTVGSANTMVNGRVVGEFLQIINTNQLVAQAGPIQLQIVSRNASAKAIQIPSVTQLVLEHGGKAEINGNGFKDQSSVKIWLFSTPTYLGEFPVDASGAFNAALLVINTLPVGQHTLQINGITPDNRIFSQSLPVFVKAKTTPSAKQPIKRVLPSINAVILGLTANSITFSYTEIDKASKYRIFITNVDSGRLVRAVEASRTRVVLANLIKSTRYSLIVIAYDNANKQIARMPGTGLAFTTLESNPQRPKISIICALPGRSMRVTGVNPKCPTGYSSEESFAPLGAIISKIGRN